MVTKRQAKVMIKNVIGRYELATKDPSLKQCRLSEQDLKTKFVVPLLQALNWNIYDVCEVREQKNFFGLLPDYTLTDSHGKIILVEAKPDYASIQLDNDLHKYLDNPNVREEAKTLWLTSFKNSRICALGKEKGIRKIDILWEHYVPNFDQLWSYLSNSEEGLRKRIYEKALAPRDRK